MNIYDFLKMVNPSDVYISVYIDESCGLDEWSVHIYEGYADEFKCTIYDLEKKYHIKELYFCSFCMVQIFLEEN